MVAKILAKDEVGEVPCEYCGKWFEFTGNGEWIPTICPECDEAGKGDFHFSDDQVPAFEDLDTWFWDGITDHNIQSQEIVGAMCAGTISPVAAESRLARVTRWPGYVRTSPPADADEGA